MAAAPSTPIALEEAYLAPFAGLVRRGVEVRDLSVTHSVKVTERRVEANRYFIRFPNTAAATDAVAWTCRQLGLPYSAERVVELEAGAWRQAGALGAAFTGGLTGYRAYFRSGVELPGEVYGRALEWSPAHPLYLWRIYTQLPEASVADAMAQLRSRLRIQAGSGAGRAVGALEKFLNEVAETVSWLEVTDRATGRVSYDFSPNYSDAVTVAQALPLLEAWFAAFEADGQLYQAWLKDAAEGRLENITFGLSGKKRFFGSLYFGKFEHPLSLAPEILEEARPAAVPVAAPVVRHAAKDGSPVFALGEIGYEWKQPARATTPAMPPDAASDVVWTLNVNQSPMYALAADEQAVEMWAQCLRDQQSESAELVCVPGRVAGSVTLPDGSIVPELRATPRGVFWWSNAALFESLGPAPAALGDLVAHLAATLRNAGTEARHRALNFLATQPSALMPSFVEAGKRGLVFEALRPAPERYGICEVRLLFRSPRPGIRSRLAAVARIDVREPIPVFAGPVRCWDVE